MEKARQYGFLSFLIPHQMEKTVEALSIGNMQDAANALQWHIYNGLCENLKTEIKLFNILPIGSFPQYYKKMFIRKSVFETTACPNNINIGFCNLKLIRNYIIPRKIYKVLYRWCKNSLSPKTLFVYTISPSFMTALKRIKKKFPQVQICTIVADLPEMINLSNSQNPLLKFFIKRRAKNSYANLDCVDCFVLLTKHMADRMKINKPYCVVEGIAPIRELREEPPQDGLKRILYTGTLHQKFGILNLLEAFKQIEDDSYRLIICGIGDSESEVRKAAEQDKRIIYLGQLPRAEVLKWQEKATALVNPRQNNEEFTKYSFPSKNLEYLSSGKPLIAYKLDGVPDEYDPYIFYVQDNSIEALKQTLIAVCENTDGTVRMIAENARLFVRDQKNEVVQTRKICQLISGNES